MTVEFGQLKIGETYVHKVHGDCVLMCPHPHDGAYLIVERYDSENDEHVFFGCVREELTLKEPA